MKVIYVEPRKSAEVVEIGERLLDLQEAVGGYIEAIYPFDDPVCLICNEEGKLMALEPNRTLRTADGVPYDVIYGPFLIAGLTADNFGGLNKKLQNKYLSIFREPEEFPIK